MFMAYRESNSGLSASRVLEGGMDALATYAKGTDGALGGVVDRAQDRYLERAGCMYISGMGYPRWFMAGDNDICMYSEEYFRHHLQD